MSLVILKLASKRSATWIPEFALSVLDAVPPRSHISAAVRVIPFALPMPLAVFELADVGGAAGMSAVAVAMVVVVEEGSNVLVTIGVCERALTMLLTICVAPDVLSAVSIDHAALPVLAILFPLAHVLVAGWISHFTLAVRLSISEVPDVPAPTKHTISALAMIFPLFVFTGVFAADKRVFPFSMLLAVFILPFISGAIWPVELAFAMLFAVFPLADILFPGRMRPRSDSAPYPIYERSNINSAIRQCFLTLSIL